MDKIERKRLIETSGVNINGLKYYTVYELSNITSRSRQAIRLLILKGNRFGKLNATKLGQTILVPAIELFNFKFSSAGRSKLVVNYNADGTVDKQFINESEALK